MQLNVKIDDEVYKAAKREAKGEDVRLRSWVENAMAAAIKKKYAARYESLKEIESSLPPRSTEMTGAKLMGIWKEGDRITDGATGGKDDCAPPPEEHVKARGKKNVRAAKPASKPVAGAVRPKINLSRLLP